MREIQIDLTLRFNIPEKGLNVNGVITGLQKASTSMFLSVLAALFQAVEQQSIEELQQAYPNQYVKNGHQSKPRSLRTSFGLFRYHLAQLYDKVNRKTIVPLRDNGFVPKYRGMHRAWDWSGRTCFIPTVQYRGGTDSPGG
jgi:hypothetical protein